MGGGGGWTGVSWFFLAVPLTLSQESKLRATGNGTNEGVGYSLG